MLRLNCPAQTYAWGKMSENSLVASLKRNSDASFEIKESTPYAELWMGTHPNGPATVESSGLPLLDYLKSNPNSVGVVPERYKTGELPFMFKVLSVRTALSIQSHPDIELAQHLHSTQPQHYKDPNHKPEMSVALTPFEAMCGFRPLSEIQSHLILYPELAAIVGPSVSEKMRVAKLENSAEHNNATNKALLKELFACFMQAPDDLVNTKISELVARISASVSSTDDSEGRSLNSLIVHLNNDFPNDRGVLCPLILNHVRLSPGEAFFMGANEPHAYLSGDCLECMALSDNTVRAGLTPKHRDVETLVNMLHYRNEGPDCHLLRPESVSAHTVLYRPPSDVCSEFEVERTTLPVGSGSYAARELPCASIFIVSSGSCTLRCDDKDGTEAQSHHAVAGSIFYVHAGCVVHIDADDGDNETVVFRAHVNLGTETSLKKRKGDDL